MDESSPSEAAPVGLGRRTGRQPSPRSGAADQYESELTTSPPARVESIW
jgi:hypothetical protein